MKTVIVAVLVLLVASQSEALKCICGGLRHCPTSVETCVGSNNVCASVMIYVGPPPRYSMGCMKSHDCSAMDYPFISTTCCTTDLCNR